MYICFFFWFQPNGFLAFILPPSGMVVYILVAQRSTFFPLSQLMIHGVIVASHGDALHWGLSKFDLVDFTQEVWSFVVPWANEKHLKLGRKNISTKTCCVWLFKSRSKNSVQWVQDSLICESIGLYIIQICEELMDKAQIFLDLMQKLCNASLCNGCFGTCCSSFLLKGNCLYC